MTTTTDAPPKYTQGAYIVAQRERRGLTRYALAKLAGLDHSHLRRIETGTEHLTKPETVERVAATLGVSADALYAADGALHPEIIAFMARTPSTIQAVRRVMRQQT